MAFFEGFGAAGVLGVDSFFVLADLTEGATFFLDGFVADAFLGGGFDAISGLLFVPGFFSDFAFFLDVRGLPPVASGILSSSGGGGVS